MFDDLLELGTFEWGGRWGDGSHVIDCYGLAIEARRRILRGNNVELPGYEWVYKRWNRETVPHDIVGKLMRKYAYAVETEIPAPGDLCLIQCERGTALGVVVNYQQSGVQDGVLFFGDSAKPQVLPNWSILGLQNFWRIDSE
jgi:hypothetical protein